MARFFNDYKGNKVATMAVFFEECYKHQIKDYVREIKSMNERGYNTPRHSYYVILCDNYKGLLNRIIGKFAESGYSDAYAKKCVSAMVAKVCGEIDYKLPHRMPTNKRR